MSDLPSEGDDGPEFQFTSLTQTNREGLVDIAGNQAPGSAFVTADLDEFQLGPLGATMTVTGAWLPREPSENGTILANNLASWRHITSQGRDQFVKVVLYGYLFPLGHLATVVSVTNRILWPDPVDPGSYADAYLQEKTFVHVTQPVVEYPTYYQPYGLGAWPFTSARILEKSSSDLDPIDDQTPIDAGSTGSYPQAFFPLSGGSPVLWTVHLYDRAGTLVTMKLPLVVVTGMGGSGYPPPDKHANAYPNSQFDSVWMGAIAKAYNAIGQSDTVPVFTTTAETDGTKIQWTPAATGNAKVKAGSTVHPTLSITLGAATPDMVPTATAGEGPGSDQYAPPPGGLPSPPQLQADLAAANQPAFYPTVLKAQIRLPAAETLSRGSYDDGTDPGGVGIFPYGPYVADQFNSTNPGTVYAGLLNSPPLAFPADMVGGLANPNLAVAGLSAAAGAIGGQLSTYATQAFSAVGAAQKYLQEYFGDLTSSNFLGGLSLADILGGFLGDLNAPSITHEEDDGTETVTYTLKASLKPVATVGFAPVGADGMFTLVATIVVSPSGSTTYQVEGTVDAFTITILDAAQVILIPFGAADGSTPGATFSASSGEKSNIQVNVGQPSFLGALDFVNTLEQFLQDIGGSGISITVGPTQISAALSLSLPSVGCGVFNLENLALSASVVVPFLGGATVATFGFCSQEQPFTLTVLCFGGGGYLLVSVGLHSLQSLTASFDFEGQLALDLGVASGGVSVMAGITFTYTESGPMAGASLYGFVRITGEVEVLGILSITIELQLTLGYSSPNTATGTATLTVSVSLCFFSISVPITVQKSFPGPSSDSDPSALRSGITSRTARKTDDAAATNPFASTSTTTFADQMSASAWSTYCHAFAS
jgi:hypothetical protein